MAQVFSLSEAASIGLHTMILLAQNKEGMNIQTITERTEFSFHHVAKVLQRLSKHNFFALYAWSSWWIFTKKRSGVYYTA